MFLKLVKSIEPPKVGDLVLNGNKLRVLGYGDNVYPEQDEVVLPYGLAYRRPQVGETCYSFRTRTIGVFGAFEDSYRDECVKVELHPEQFNYTEIVDLKLMDGDGVDVVINTHPNEPCVNGGKRLFVTKTSPLLYTEDELDMVLNEFGNKLMLALSFKEIQKSSNGIAEYVADFLKEKQKKKQ
jgi:hypothetical protein